MYTVQFQLPKMREKREREKAAKCNTVFDATCFVQVCIYDRAGLGFSERPSHNMTAPPGTDKPENFIQHSRGQFFTAERSLSAVALCSFIYLISTKLEGAGMACW